MCLNFTVRTALWSFLQSLFLGSLCFVGAWNVLGFVRAEFPESGEYANYYAAEEKASCDALNSIRSLPKLESPAAHRERKLAETGADPEAAKEEKTSFYAYF